MMREKLYFMGIGGTGMAAVAGLFKEAGFDVCGSDKGVYPPMSDMLADLKINYRVPYDAKNLIEEKADLVVVANALSRGNPELEYMLEQKIPYTSFPALMGDRILADRCSVVVAGTHGKTTTTSLLAHVLTVLGEEPGFLIGGIPRNFALSFHLGKGRVFAIEGDEYDTAFFDKGPKFLHYRPSLALLNNLEFDHADIYKNLDEIERQFTKLCGIVQTPKQIIANVDDPGMANLLRENGYWNRVTRVASKGLEVDANVRVTNVSVEEHSGQNTSLWRARIQTESFGNLSLTTALAGEHNIANIAQVIATVERLYLMGELHKRPTTEDLQKAIASFAGVKRRLDLLASVGGIDVFEDFAHHPTAITTVIDGFRRSYPTKRVIVAFEPANATGRRNILQSDFAKALGLADQVLIGKCPVDTRIPEAERMDTTGLVTQIGTSKAKAYKENEHLLEDLKHLLKPGDAIIFMSPSSFSGIQHSLGPILAKQQS
jgi:UDP-N-acetylmuramate: L-alanyl-gamma-D-glutamyl-meso-diaminopimelate ligase